MAFHFFVSCMSKKTPSVYSLRLTLPFRTSTWSQSSWTKVSKTLYRSRRANLNLQATAQYCDLERTWSYGEDCKTWTDKFPHCGSSSQSPVSLCMSEVDERSSIACLVWENLDEVPYCMKLKNNGHTISMEGTWPECKTPIITLKTTGHKFEFLNIHWHWGTDCAAGSEHEIDGQKAAMEMHLVFSKVDCERKRSPALAYGLLLKKDNNASCTPCGIAVVARNMEAVLKNGAEKELEPLPLRDFIDLQCKRVLSYCGSLTMPPCDEPVLWLVAAESGVVTDQEIKAFRAVTDYDGKSMSGNIRPLQPFNNRKVTLFE